MVSRLTPDGKKMLKAELRARTILAKECAQGMEDHDLKVELYRSILAGVPFSIEEAARIHGVREAPETPHTPRESGQGRANGDTLRVPDEPSDLPSGAAYVRAWLGGGLSDSTFQDGKTRLRDAGLRWAPNDDTPVDKKLWHGVMHRERAGELRSYLRGLGGHCDLEFTIVNDADADTTFDLGEEE